MNVLQPALPDTVPSPENAIVGRTSARTWPGRSPRAQSVPTRSGFVSGAKHRPLPTAPPPAADGLAAVVHAPSDQRECRHQSKKSDCPAHRLNLPPGARSLASALSAPACPGARLMREVASARRRARAAHRGYAAMTTTSLTPAARHSPREADWARSRRDRSDRCPDPRRLRGALPADLQRCSASRDRVRVPS